MSANDVVTWLAEQRQVTIINDTPGSSRIGIPDESNPVFRWKWFSGDNLGKAIQNAVVNSSN